MSWFIASTAFIVWIIIAVHSMAKQIRPYFTKDWIRSSDPIQNIAYLGLIIGASIAILGYHEHLSLPIKLVSDFYANVSTELISIAITILVIDRLTRRRVDREVEQQRKADLIFQMGSPNNVLAIEAVRSLREKGWLLDGSLNQITLKNANLQEASLSNASLSHVNLQGANLKNANLSYTNLQNANLSYTSLQNANLSHANLQNVNLTFANLKNADLSYANLENAELSHANLQGATMMGTKFNRVNLGYRDTEGIIRVSTNLQNASYNPATKYVAPTEFPDGFDPELFGMKKVMIILADPPTVPD